MSIELAGKQRGRFTADLKVHRESYTLNDADYAEQVLKVSLNTFKKCMSPTDHKPLALRRHTFVSIFANTGLDPKDYGLSIGIPSQASPYGSYKKSEFKHLCGRYFLYRRTFLTARHITRSILEVGMSKSHECLSFSELHYYMAEVGTREELRYQGEIYMNHERSILSLPSYDHGQVRLTLLQPERLSGGRIKMRGALLTYGNPKGYWQPTVSCVFAVGPITGNGEKAKDLCQTIESDSKEYSALSAELAFVEEHASIITPLIWARNGKPGQFGHDGSTS